MNKNEFCKRPPMGWNSYDYYDTTVTEADIRANAAFMAEHLKDAGWEYVVVDIEWYAHDPGTQRDLYQYIPFWPMEMDEYSRVIPDPVRFPSSVNGAGFRPLADYVHSLGLKFGIHVMRGIPRQAAAAHAKIKGTDVTANQIADPSSICKWNPDMYGVRDMEAGQLYYDSVIELYAEWGVDFIKCDDICVIESTDVPEIHRYASKHEIRMIAKAIEKQGRPIVFSLSPGPAHLEQAWIYQKYANMWRITGDFWDDWKALKNMFCRCELWQDHVKEGCYPDCDMLPLGKLGRGFGDERDSNFNKEEERTMYTLWCIFGSPLMAGGDMLHYEEDVLEMLNNKEVLELLDPDCRGRQVIRDEEKAIWIAENRWKKTAYAALFNLSDEEKEISGTLDELHVGMESLKCRELWTGESNEISGKKISAVIPAHGCKLYQILD
ncbi:MAG: glycoside hydrolase family 27 protein [Clostridiales bacterium]|nr:glycoside hydrolase family 27 protein [Candidatus Blautia equi]